MYGLPMVPPSSLSPSMLQRRGVLPPPTTLGLSPSPHMLARISPHSGDNSDMMPPPPLSKVEEDIPASTTTISTTPACTVTSKDVVAMDTIAELKVPSAPCSRGSSRVASPTADCEPQGETFGHKKFDKFRKVATQSAGGEEGEGKKARRSEESILVDGEDQASGSAYINGCPVTPPGNNNSNGGSDNSSDSGRGSSSRRSAKESHPHLLAFLNSPSQTGGGSLTPPHSTTTSVVGAPSSFLWHGPYSKEAPSRTASAIASALAMGLDQRALAMDLASSKEQFHATTVSNLKEKLMRKFDSSENLHKASSSPSSLPTSSSTATAASVPLTSSSSPAHNGLVDGEADVAERKSSPSSSVTHTPTNSPTTPNLPPTTMMSPPGLHPAVYHSMLSSHYAMQAGIHAPVVTLQHLAGLQQQFAKMFASSVNPSSSTSTPSGCPVSSTELKDSATNSPR